MEVIANGLDSLASEPRVERRDLRQELAIGDDELLIGHVARFDPMKDHHTLLQAFGAISLRRDDVHLVMVGPGIDGNNERLIDWIRATGAGHRVHLLGPSGEVGSLYPSFDVVVLSSAFGEGLPVALGEAMSMGIPVVATDVGDAAMLIADEKRVVPVKDPQALAGALNNLLDFSPDDRRALGLRDRARVQEGFGVGRMVRSFSALYERVAPGDLVSR